MRIVTLVEDTTKNPDIKAEHGLSLYIETAGHVLLADTGAGGIILDNAKRLGIDLGRVDTVIISHGHYDHAGGLMAYAGEYQGADIYMNKRALGDYYHGERYIGIDKRIAGLPGLVMVENDDRYDIDDELSLFAGISGRRLWPAGNLLLSERIDGKTVQDEFRHEQCLVIRENNKYTLVSGCAHNGVLNILSRFRSIYGVYPDNVISGFHMMKAGAFTEAERAYIYHTAEELNTYDARFITGHCTNNEAYELMKSVMGDKLQHFSSGCEIIL